MNRLILNKAKELFESQIDEALIQSELEDWLYEFARECCELQKQECANVGYNFGNSARDVVQEEILNCKNICDES